MNRNLNFRGILVLEGELVGIVSTVVRLGCWFRYRGSSGGEVRFLVWVKGNRKFGGFIRCLKFYTRGLWKSVVLFWCVQN